MAYLRLDFPHGSDSKEFAFSAWAQGSIPGSERSPGEGNEFPLRYSCLKNYIEEPGDPTGSHRVRQD